MSKYTVQTFDTGSTVFMLCGTEYRAVVHFTNPDHVRMAKDWVRHSEYLDQLDNG